MVKINQRSIWKKGQHGLLCSFPWPCIVFESG